MNRLALPGLLCCVLAFALPAEAKLNHLTFFEFVDAADVVVRARAVSAFTEDYHGGSALLEIQDVLFGEYRPRKYMPRTLTISWSSEVHDQPITHVGGVYILFLRRTDNGDYKPAAYGMSYWKVTRGNSDPEVVRYEYPVSQVEIPKTLLVQAHFWKERWPDKAVEIKETCISVPKLIQAVLARKQSAPKHQDAE